MRQKCTASLAATLVLACTLAIGLLVPGCPPPPPPPPICTTNADCATGQVCNTATGQCEEVPTGCTSDADCPGQVCNLETGECEDVPTGCTSDDCEEGEFCDAQTGECFENVDAFANTAFTDDDGPAGPTHAAHAAQGVSCTSCHHAEPVSAAGMSCTAAGCHSDNRDELNSFKDVAHDQNGSGDGCRSCHEDDWDTCGYCHPDFPGS